jgi:FixJ family two-component response regulator
VVTTHARHEGNGCDRGGAAGAVSLCQTTTRGAVEHLSGLPRRTWLRRRSVTGRPPPGAIHAADGRQSAVSDARPVVVIIDDDPEIRNALQGLLETVDLQAALFATASEFLACKRPDGPCCIVVGVRLPGLSGLDFQQELLRENISTPIIFITGHGDIPMSVRAMKAGAVEFLTKPVHDQALLDAIQAALRRDRARLEDERRIADNRTRHESLSARERQVMALLVSGRANKQIAFEIGISEVTAARGERPRGSERDLLCALDRLPVAGVAEG